MGAVHCTWQLLCQQKGWDRGSGWWHPFLLTQQLPCAVQCMHPVVDLLSHHQLQQLCTILWCNLSLVPRPSHFRLLLFRFCATRKIQNGGSLGTRLRLHHSKYCAELWNTYHVNDVCGGELDIGGEGSTFLIVECSNDSQDPTHSQDRQYQTKKSLYCLLHTNLYLGTIPLTFTLCPPDVIHVIGVPRHSQLFTALRFYNECEPKNKIRGKPGNEASAIYT